MRSIALARAVQEQLQDWADEQNADMAGMPLRQLVQLTATAASVEVSIVVPVWSSVLDGDGAMPTEIALTHARRFLERIQAEGVTSPGPASPD